tara:strand:- start:43 stop:225 length:183 start_codon:yes stop_codon:yes gene_type:complete
VKTFNNNEKSGSKQPDKTNKKSRLKEPSPRNPLSWMRKDMNLPNGFKLGSLAVPIELNLQ